MINARVNRDGNGRLRLVCASGHAEFAQKGADIVCAAVSILLRTTAAVLSQSKTVSVCAEAPERGFFTLKVQDFLPEDGVKLVYAADFLIQGLQSLENEFPECVSVNVQTEK